MSIAILETKSEDEMAPKMEGNGACEPLEYSCLVRSTYVGQKWAAGPLALGLSGRAAIITWIHMAAALSKPSQTILFSASGIGWTRLLNLTFPFSPWIFPPSLPSCPRLNNGSHKEQMEQKNDDCFVHAFTYSSISLFLSAWLDCTVVAQNSDGGRVRCL